MVPMDSKSLPSGYVPIEHLEALVRLLGPEEMTPTAARVFRQVMDKYRA